ncbi:MAG: polyprenol phosphomannose-dependent alpha 1,6 mannosyltransferase MptB [Solirubrobacteraceae bacterium]
MTSRAAALLGLAGSLLVAYAAPRALDDRVVGWWYRPGFPAGQGTSLVLVWVGMIVLALAWLALGRELASERALMGIAVAWALPLALGPPLFSRDVYSYLAQGTILHLGHSPYHSAPALLAGLGHRHVLAAVSPFWRSTTAPYGPLFLGLVSLVVGAVGSHLVAGVLLTRLVSAVGFVLLAVAMPRLARAMGGDPRRALWLVLLSPLMMLQLVSAVHNDLLMAGLLALGVAVALRGHPLQGIALCALAATVKVPALAGVLFIAVAWGRAERDMGARIRLAAAAAGITVVVLGAVTLITGAGLSWLSTSLFSTPARVRLAITPATAIGYTLAMLAHLATVTVSSRSLEGAVGVVGSVLTAVAGAVLCYRVVVGRLVLMLGGFLLIAAAGGPAAWPWYFTWGLVLVAALRGPRRWGPVAVAIAVSALVVKPDGILALPIQSAPIVLIIYVLIAAAVWRRRPRAGDPWRPPAATRAERPVSAPV